MKLLKNKYNLLIIFAFALSSFAKAQDSTARKLILTIAYYMPGDKIPYLLVSAKEKVERKFIPLKGIAAAVYTGEEADAGLLERIKTDKKGESKVFIPASFKPGWDSAVSLTFIAVTDASKEFESAKSEIQITKARIEIDTVTEEETKNILVKVSELKDGEWLPAKDVELKVAVKRLLGNLPVGDEETYTTDSTGIAVAEFKRDSLFGDSKGNYTLTARTEDNEFYGNIFAEKTVNWGVAPKKDDSFGKRSLWATRFKTPVWLLGLAYVIIAGVWGVLIYLIMQIIKIRRLGKNIT